MRLPAHLMMLVKLGLLFHQLVTCNLDEKHLSLRLRSGMRAMREEW